ncbi:hypothetical protein D7X33_34890 [Butyricicoccus sp. 1XD8-22]|nr:hypothetical protein D7X33_34890 [Butyricicoccus sp. 1XD8-22]
MSYESYRARLSAYGGSLQNSVKKTSKRSQEQLILNSPSRVDLQVNDELELSPCIVSDIDTFYKRRFLFLPDKAISIGNTIKHDGFTYLATDQTMNEIFPELIAQLCNSTFPIITTTTDYYRDENGNLVYDDITGEVIPITTTTQIDLPCVVENKYRVSDKSEQMWIAENDITVILPYHAEIKMGMTFQMYDDIYKVINIDQTKVIGDVGILTLRGEKESSK